MFADLKFLTPCMARCLPGRSTGSAPIHTAIIGVAPKTGGRLMVPAEKNSRSAMTQLAPYMGMGFQLAAAMVLFGAIGWWLDGKFGTAPWLLAAGCVLGAAGGMTSLIRTSLKKPDDVQK